MPLLDLDLRPSLSDEPGASFAVGSYANKKEAKPRKLREGLRLTVDEDSSFDDTFRLREAGMAVPQAQNNQRQNPPAIDDKSTSKNYNSQIIDGEHKSLLSLGKINESMEDDEHGEHILEHRILLANPKLTETQRANLMAHIESHVKAKGKKMKELKAAAEGKDKQSQQDVMTGAAKYKKGFGMQSKALPATTYDVVPQDSRVDQERKRTAGNMSMESRFGRFDRALRTSRRRRHL
jgi:hypothetical protein